MHAVETRRNFLGVIMSWQTDINEYFKWAEKQLSGGIAYPSSYDMREPKGGRVRTSIVPLNVQVPSHLETIDLAMKLIPKPLAKTLEVKYCARGESDKERAEKAGIKYGTFKLNIIRASNFLDGCYAMERMVNHGSRKY